jgi:glycosyltransferase
VISVITPCLNSAAVIGDCLDSVAGQPVAVEHLLVDGGSSDGTLEILQEHEGPIKLLSDRVTGIYAAINAGIQAASGDIIGALNADDFYATPDILNRVLSAFEDDRIDACYGDLCYVDGSNPSQIVRYWQAGQFSTERLRHGWMPPHPTFFIRRQVYERTGLYREDLGTAADYELMLRVLLKHRIRVTYVPRVIVHMRTGGASNASLRARITANRMDRAAWRINGLSPYPWTLISKPLRKLPQWWRRPKGPNSIN